MDNLLKIVADNPQLMEVLRKTIESEFSLDLLSDKLENEVLGQMVRARLVGLECVARAFNRIGKYKSSSPLPEKVNGAR